MQDKYHRIDKIWKNQMLPTFFLLGILPQPGSGWSFSWASGRGQRQRPVSVKACLWKKIFDHPWSLFLLWGDRRRQQGGKGPSKTTCKDVTWKIGLWCFKVCLRKRKGKIQKQGEKRPGNSMWQRNKLFGFSFKVTFFVWGLSECTLIASTSWLIPYTKVIRIWRIKVKPRWFAVQWYASSKKTDSNACGSRLTILYL